MARTKKAEEEVLNLEQTAEETKTETKEEVKEEKPKKETKKAESKPAGPVKADFTTEMIKLGIKLCNDAQNGKFRDESTIYTAITNIYNAIK